jgi:Domain of unknown function (DUF3806)
MPTISTRPLDSQERAGIAQATAWVNEVLERGFSSDIRLTSRREDIPALHFLLSNGPFGADAVSELTVFGTVIGEILNTDIPMTWVVVEDEHGSDFALQYRDLDVFVFPRDMILKRVERGEDVSRINLDVMLEEIRKTVHDEAQNVSR